MTKNNQCKNLTDSSKVFVLYFLTEVEAQDSQVTGQHMLLQVNHVFSTKK